MPRFPTIYCSTIGDPESIIQAQVRVPALGNRLRQFGLQGLGFPRRMYLWARNHGRADVQKLNKVLRKDQVKRPVQGHTEFLELQGWPGVWSLGDCSAVPDRLTGKFHPPTAQHAQRQGKIAAHNVIAAIRGTEKKRFDFSTIAQLATIGRRTGVANILGINFSGFIAWWLWRTIYLF